MFTRKDIIGKCNFYWVWRISHYVLHSIPQTSYPPNKLQSQSYQFILDLEEAEFSRTDLICVSSKISEEALESTSS